MKKIQFPQRKAVTEYFDKTASGYYSWYYDRSWLGHPFRIRKARVLELFDQPGGEVLDVGCGPGVMVKDLIEQDCNFWGVDVSHEMVKIGQNNFVGCNNVHFCLGTSENLGFRSDVFDAVISVGAIEFFDDDELALNEMIRVLKRGGTLIIGLVNKYSPFLLWRDFIFYPATCFIRPIYYGFAKRPRKPHIRQKSYTKGTIGRILEQNNCIILDIVYFNFNIFLPPLEHIFPRLSAVVSQRLEHLCRGKLRWLGSGFIVKAKKR